MYSKVSQREGPTVWASIVLIALVWVVASIPVGLIIGRAIHQGRGGEDE
jgi:hypothetical protein